MEKYSLARARMQLATLARAWRSAFETSLTRTGCASDTMGLLACSGVCLFSADTQMTPLRPKINCTPAANTCSCCAAFGLFTTRKKPVWYFPCKSTRVHMLQEGAEAVHNVLFAVVLRATEYPSTQQGADTRYHVRRCQETQHALFYGSIRLS